MIDLQKYTKMCQLREKIMFLQTGIDSGVKPSASYVTQLEKYRKQYNQLYIELSGQMNLPVNLKDYVRNLVQYLDSKNPNGEKWFYHYEELVHKVTEQEHFYGYHTYHDYKYQVELLNGDRAIPVCVVDRELDYANDKLTINLLHDTMLPPFSLRLDETSDEFDEETCKDLKKIYFKTYLQAKQHEMQKEMSLIEKRIKEMQKQDREMKEQYKQVGKQLDDLKLDDLDLIDNIKK